MIKGSLSATQMIVFSFITIICIGTLLLLLPFSTKGSNLNFINALFTAVSATCVTGLTVIDIGKEFTRFGQLVVLILIQLGGLGIMTFSTFFLYLLGGRASIRNREIIDSTLSYSSVPNLKILLQKIMFLVFIVEGIGVVCLSLAWIRYYPLPEAIYHGFFHSISAFCNAGFSLYSNSFERFSTDYMLNIFIILLIISGGLGFIVLLELKSLFNYSKQKIRSLSFQSKVVLTMTFFLIMFGTLLIYLVESPHTLSHMKPINRFIISLFQSVTARTAGFNTLSIGLLTNGGCLILMILMFVGAAPGSCGGGVKVSTLGVLIAMVLSRIRRHEETQLFSRSIPGETESKALVIVISAGIIILIIFFGLLLTEDWFVSPEQSRDNFLELFFESISAFGTVGLSMGITPQLSIPGQLLIIILMFIGRLGPLTMAVALARAEVKGRYRYARGEIMLG
jgi:trk system potassium uptake protein TrkH